jgi:lipoic acid synthetase
MTDEVVQIGGRVRAQGRQRLPRHCARPLAAGPAVPEIQRMLRRSGLHSVCEEAHCPNRGECWSHRHVTFLLLGGVCTRACGFCAVATGRPGGAPDPGEPRRVALAVAELGLAHAVLTSVTRDDLRDGGAAAFAATVGAIRAERPQTTVEVLTPDFRGDREAVATVCAAGPDVFNHNVETVPRLYPRVRPAALFERSLAVLSEARRLRPASVVKTGLMVGLGEEFDEVVDLMGALRAAGVDALTIGQYLRPTRRHLPVARYWEPEEFDALAAAGDEMGFAQIASAPLVRSSFDAGRSFQAIRTGANGAPGPGPRRRGQRDAG